MRHLRTAAFLVVLAGLAGTERGVAAEGNQFSPGYCTWDAAEQAHLAWGVWPPWNGDAGDWAAGARAEGWDVSAQPRAGSIVAMPRGVQGSGPLGHVGWVVAVDADGSDVTVRSMNWAGRGLVSLHPVRVDGEVQFIMPPSSLAAASP